MTIGCVVGVGLCPCLSSVDGGGPLLTLRAARQNDRARLRAASELAPSGLTHASAVFPPSPRSFE